MSDVTKTAIITGASRGIGAAAAHELAAQGYAVMLAARNADAINALAAEITQAGGQAMALPVDVSRWYGVELLVNRTVKAFGRLDLMVNNAGVIDPIGPLMTSDPESWGHAADINYKGIYYGLRAAMPVMAQQGSGVIVNISSGAATSDLEGWSMYCSSKAAAAMLTRCAQREAPKAVRVVGLSPGTVATEMQVTIKASGINPVSQLDPSVHIPAEWPAKAIAWLATDDAAEFAGTDVSLRDEDIRRRIGLAVE
ncbi:SDR family oxidoreductase [Halovulum sp. GXIMD14793]